MADPEVTTEETTEEATEEETVTESASTDPKLLLISTVSSAYPSYPIMLQGSMSAEATYPDSFFTFWNNYTNDEAFYDNTEHQVIWEFDLNFYSNNPTLVNTVLLAVKAAVKAVGFIPDGSGHDVVSDEPTHTGRGLTLLYIERK